MSKPISFEPKEVTIPASGGVAKIRIRNPNTKKFFYWVELSDPNNFTIDMQPMDYIPMGVNRCCTITKKPGAGKCKITLKWYDVPSNPNAEFALPDQPLGICEATIKG